MSVAPTPAAKPTRANEPVSDAEASWNPNNDWEPAFGLERDSPPPPSCAINVSPALQVWKNRQQK
eukprot:899548-Pelagomonas_calceolata.AAC.1